MPFSASTLLLFCACLLVSFLYAGIEAGLLSLDRTRLRSRVQQDDRAAVRLDRLLAHPGRLLATVLMVTNFADVAALILFTNAVVPWLGPRGYVAAGAVMLPVYLLGVQLLPKSLFRRFPYRALAALAGLLELTTRLLAPVLVVGSWLLHNRWIVPHAEREARKGPGSGLFIAREEFKNLAAEGERTGAITPAEHGMIDNVIDFGAVPTRELMRPPPEPMPAGEKQTVADLLEFARARRLDYVPIADASGQGTGRTGGRVYPFARTRPPARCRRLRAPSAAGRRARRTGRARVAPVARGALQRGGGVRHGRCVRGHRAQCRPRRAVDPAEAVKDERIKKQPPKLLSS